MPIISKWIFIVVMWVGRLEVIPVVMLIMALFGRSD
jgi:trk system potassium uptake protein TrkH